MTPRSLVLISIAALLAAAGIGGAYWVRSSAPPPVVQDVPTRSSGLLPGTRTVPPFSFAESRGGTIGNEELRGKVWVADFIFTSCAGTCPAMTAQMRTVQDALGGDLAANIDAGINAGINDVRLVSFSVDPERDTPEVLRAYAEKTGAKENWLFLRGPSLEVARLARQGFLLGNPVPGLPLPGSASAGDSAAGSDATNPEWEPLAHDRHFALVDRQGRIRGYYDGVDPEVVPILARDVRTLVAEKTSP